jgi:hypothetical protein
VEVWTVRRSEKVMGESTLFEEEEMVGEIINDVHDTQHSLPLCFAYDAQREP